MIRFSCRCGHKFEMPEDTAGTSVQCPDCRLLNDVPLLGDNGFTPDGIYKIERESSSPKPTAVDDLLYVFQKGREDADGNSIDLRNSTDEIDDVGAYDTVEQARRRERPRYDPETGELLKPIPIAPPLAQTVLAPAPDVVYASAETIQPQRSVLLDLIQPHNVTVMLFVLLIFLIGGLTGGVVLGHLYFFTPVLAAIFVSIMAHYGNVVNEIGPEDRDELPRVLGDMRLREDLWLPAAEVGTALAICYGPAIAIFFLAPLSTVIAAGCAAALAVVGTFLFPALALTLITSGAIANLRPDRVLAIIHRFRPRYYRLVLAFFIGLAASAWASVSIMLEVLRMTLAQVNVPQWMTALQLASPLLLIGIFAMHYFCWQLGLFYRMNHPKFPWVGRMHEGTPRPPVVRRRPRYVAAKSQD